MASDDVDLQEIAKQHESEELANIKFTLDSVSDFDKLLLEAYSAQCPKPIDYFNRRDLIRIFNIIAKEIYDKSDSSPVVECYGSFIMDIFSNASDLDLSINFNNNTSEVPRQKKIETLRKFAKKLQSIQRKGHVRGVQAIVSARVPIVKVTDSGTGIECDLSVENRDGIWKSHIIHAVSLIDERFQKLSFLMKSWAKTHNVNSSKDRTLNSLSIISLVAFHLQTRNPPILPPFSALLKEGADPAAVVKVISSYLNYGKDNRESLAELFITLFVKLVSVEKLWPKGLCVSLYEGSWISKSWGSRRPAFSVEDFSDRSQNVARAVGTAEVKKIYRCIRKSLNHFSDFLNGRMQGTQLVGLLFGRHTVSTLGRGVTGHIDETKKTEQVDETKTGQVDKTKETGEVDASKETGHVDNSMETGHIDASKETGHVDNSKETGHVDNSKETGHVDNSKETGHVDNSKETGHADASKETGHVDASTETGNLDETKKTDLLNKTKETGNPPCLQNPRPPKWMRVMGRYETKQVKKPIETNYPVQGLQRTEPRKDFVQGHRADVVPWGGTFQPPPAISNSDNKVPYGYGPGADRVVPWGGNFQHPGTSSFDNKVPYGYGPGAAPVVPWGGTFQHPGTSSFDSRVPHSYGPGAISVDHNVYHNYGPGVVPSTFPLNPLGFEGSHNPLLQSHASPLNSPGFIGAFHQRAVNPNPYLGPIHSSFTQISHNLQQGGPYYSNAQN